MSLRTLAARTGGLLTEKKYTISICESCTGGMLGAAITGIPGSSKYFVGGIIAYSNDIKSRIVGVEMSALEHYGAVSAVVARKMAMGVKKKMKTRVGVGITGVAGPGGGSRGKPVGTVYIAVVAQEKMFVKHHLFKGNREKIRRSACEQALVLINEILNDG